ncbi:MAG: hypothetical protein R3E39_27605 [Anaerolineae bacterium]
MGGTITEVNKALEDTPETINLTRMVKGG